MSHELGSGALILVFAVSGCGFIYDDRGGPAIADAIREASAGVTEEVTYQPGDYLAGGVVDIVMPAGTTEEEATALVCDVALPIVAQGDPPNGLTILVSDPTDSVLAHDGRPCA